MKLTIGLGFIAIVVIIALFVAVTARVEGAPYPNPKGEYLARAKAFFYVFVYGYIGTLAVAGAVWCFIWIGIVVHEWVQWFFEALLSPLGLLLN